MRQSKHSIREEPEVYFLDFEREMPASSKNQDFAFNINGLVPWKIAEFLSFQIENNRFIITSLISNQGARWRELANQHQKEIADMCNCMGTKVPEKIHDYSLRANGQ